LVSQIGSGFVRGMMGTDPVYLKAVPCGKHYVANNAEFNRLTGNSVLEERDMHEFYLLPYRNLIEKEKLPAVMAAYNSVNGVPMSANKFLVDTIVKRTYGLNGYVTGDCDAVADIFTGHKYAKSGVEGAAMGLKAGVDCDCGSEYQGSAIQALKNNLIAEADMDKALVHLFTVRMRTGEFDPKSKVPYAGIKPSIVNDPSHNDLAIEVATKTPVLLKNTLVSKTGQKALPINPGAIKKIAIIGPQAESVELGPYSGKPESGFKVTPLAGIQDYIKQNNLQTEVVYGVGGNSDKRGNFLNIINFTTLNTDQSSKLFDATLYDGSSKGIVSSTFFGTSAVKGINDGSWTSYNNIDVTNLDSLKINLSLPNNDGGIVVVRLGSSTGNLIATEKVTGTGQPTRGFSRAKTVAFKVNTLGIKGVQTLVFVYHALEIAGVDKATVALAASADVAIVFVGTNDRIAGESNDRFTIDLPGNQYDLIKAVAAVNRHTIVVMQSLGMLEVDQFKDIPNVAGIIWTGFNGQGQGTAMAKILFGDVNPGGKLNATWYKSLNDLPDLEDYSLRRAPGKNGRTYWYFNKPVSYEFGYGLSYTTFGYSNFAISKNNITPNDKIRINVDVKNTGSVDGDEVVQIYVKTPDSPTSLDRPIKRLKGFQRVTIAAGQTKTVSIDIDCADLWFWDPKSNKVTFDQGKYVFEVGSSSKDIRGQVEATMNGLFNPVLKTVVAECGNVVMKPGNTTQTRVTASLSDDSFYDIMKATVVYKSNNPAVASVNEKGLVTANSIGTALIDALVTINGVTVSGSYPLKVMPDLNLKSISVNGKNSPGLNPGLTAYSYLLSHRSKVPLIAATAASNISVAIMQADAIPGTAIITLTDNVSLEKKDYDVNFGTAAVGDDFNNAVLDKQWNWVRENPANWSLSKKSGALVITSAKGDIVDTTNNAENILLQSANTDWVIETKITCSRKPSGFSQNAGLLSYQDDDNFVKLVYTSSTGRRVFGSFGTTSPGEQPGSVELIIENGGKLKSTTTLLMNGIIKDDNTLILKLVKKGSLYTAYCSPDGVKFETVGSEDVALKNIKAGMIVCNGVTPARGFFPAPPQQTTGTEKPFEVAFDYFHITNSGQK
ncbi:MAG: glycoside hydrolase family 3 C-terminal domain-containing protein, partial [Mucilaginibacter sp.]